MSNNNNNNNDSNNNNGIDDDSAPIGSPYTYLNNNDDDDDDNEGSVGDNNNNNNSIDDGASTATPSLKRSDSNFGIALEPIRIQSSSNNIEIDILKNHNNTSGGDFNINKSNQSIELNQRIKKRFDESIIFFNNLLNIVTSSGTPIPSSIFTSTTSPNKPSNNKNNNNNITSSPNNIIFIPNELKNSKKERSNENLLNSNGSSGSSGGVEYNDNNIELNSIGGDIDNINTPYDNSNNNNSLYNSIDDQSYDQQQQQQQEQDQDILQMKKELQAIFLDYSFKKREEISFSLSAEQNPLRIDQMIDQYFESFVNDCYNEIIFKFQYQFPNMIDTIKMMRKSPDIKSVEARKSVDPSQYVPIHKTHTPDGQFSIKEFFKSKFVGKFNKEIFLSFFLSMLPIIRWVPNYKLKFIKDDVISSLTVGLMLVPQSMAYAILGGLPAIVGLYSAFIGPIVYGFLGTSNEISVGPVAMVSLLIPNVIGLPSSDPEYIVEAICLSLLSGLVLMTIGFLRVGFIIENLLSNPILMGFIQAASFLIICSQVKNLTQIPVPSTVSTFPEFVRSYIEHAGSIHGWTVLFGVSALVILIVFRYLNQKIKFKIPIAVIILILSTLISFFIDSKSHGIKIIDNIPNGLPSPKSVPLSFERVGKLLVGAFIISILGFVESISIAKKFSSIRKYSIDPSQELIALGMVNFVGSFFGAMPSTGSFSRTAVNFQTNSRSRVCSIVSGIIVACVLLFLTPVIKHTPLCILSAIVIAAAISLFEFHESWELFKSGELLGFAQLIFIFLITLMLGSEIGIVVAFVVSILQIIYFSARPKLVTLGRLPGTLVFRNINHYSGAITNRRVKILRYDARLTYFTVNHFRDCLYNSISEKSSSSSNDNMQDDGSSSIIDDYNNSGPSTPTLSSANIKNNNNNNDSSDTPSKYSIHTIIFDMVNVSSIDSTAIDVLNEIIDYFKSQNITILWSDLRPSVQTVMHRSGFLKRLDHHHFFNSTDKALEYALHD